MGFEITKGAIFYFLIMIVVIYIGIAIVTGLNPLTLLKKIDSTFEPGKVYVTNAGTLDKNIELGCLGTNYILTLDGAKFGYKGTGDKLEFIVVLDYKNLLFVGHYGDEEKITCTAEPDKYNCPQELKLSFELAGTGGITGKQTFHFTTWLARPAVIDAVKQTHATLDKILDSYSDSYLSSFDATVNVQTKCKETECGSQSNEPDCKATSGCYWGGWPWSKSCKVCSSSTNCNDYDSGACIQCPIPAANCKPGTLYGCEPK